MADWIKYNWFWQGIRSEYRTCCIFFFMNVWTNFDKETKKNWTSTGEGFIPCAECLARLMQEEKLVKEIEGKCNMSDTEKDFLIQRVRS